jgi:hypothetical protein
MPPDEELIPVNVAQAADRLDRAPGTIRCWASRYGARKLGRDGRNVVYDYSDLSVIDRELRHGHPVPPTPEERAAISGMCPIRAAEFRLQAA